MGALTPRLGEVLTVDCEGCGRPITYEYKGGRVRRYHQPDPNAPDDPDCRVIHYNNALRPVSRDKAYDIEVATRLDAAVAKRLADLFGEGEIAETEVFTLAGGGFILNLLPAERDALLAAVERAREELFFILNHRGHGKRDAPGTVLAYREVVEKSVLPALTAARDRLGGTP